MLFKSDSKARAQHAAVRENAGWYRWTHDLVEVSGGDATGLLDYLYVNAIAKAGVGRSKYTTMLNEEGRILDDVIVMRMEEDKYWVSTLYAPRLLPWIDAHKGGRAVACRDITYEVDMYAIQGPQSLAMLGKLLDTPIEGMKRFEHAENSIGGIPVRVHRSGFTGELGYEIYCDTGRTHAVRDAIAEAGNTAGATEMDILEVYVRSLPMEKGFALRQDMYGLTPYEAALGWSVDMGKDFLGKEALARAQAEGPRQALVGLELEAESYEDISQGERIRLRGRDIGLVRAMIYGYTVEKNIGFAVVDAEFAAPGTRVEIGCHDAPAVLCQKQWI